MLSLRQFENKRHELKKRKIFVILILIGSLLISTIYIYTYIIYSPPSDFPVIKIITDDNLSYDNYVSCTTEIESDDESDRIDPIEAKMKISGSGLGWNKMSPKKGYILELSEQKSLLGMREDDDWRLMSLYLDYPRTRTKLSIELWRSLLPTNPTAILPNSKYICLYLNGEFQGLYLLAEKDDRRLFGLDDAQNNINSSLIIQAKGGNSLNKYSQKEWEQDWPNEDENIFIMNDILTKLSIFFTNTTDSEFFHPTDGIYTKYYKENLIDFYVFNFFIDHQDFWNHNYYIVRNSHPGKFFLIPWDFDLSFGQYIWKEYDANINREGEIRRLNILYNRLLSNQSFREDCKNRWFELRETIWSEEIIVSTLSEMYEDIEMVLETDINMWNMRSPILFREERVNDIDESIKLLYNWISERLEFCDLYFSRI